MPLLLIMAGALAAAPVTTPQLAAAEDLISQVRYADAEKALAAARAQPSNPREVLLRILELQGIVAATLNQAPKARGLFLTLLTLDPPHKLPEGQPPRVKTPFYEAKGMASEGAQMLLTTSSDSGPDGAHFHAQLSADPLAIAKKVRFHQREAGETAWVDQIAPLEAGTASVVGGPGRLEWWVELLGEQDATLLTAGSALKPFADGVARAKVASAPPEVVAPPPERASNFHVSPAAVGLLAGAAAVTVGGVVAGVLSKGAASQVDGAVTDGNGVVTGLTQRQAASLKDAAKTDAIVANVCFGVAIALAGTGVAVLVLQRNGSDVALAPGPNGVALVGHFP